MAVLDNSQLLRNPQLFSKEYKNTEDENIFGASLLVIRLFGNTGKSCDGIALLELHDSHAAGNTTL